MIHKKLQELHDLKDRTGLTNRQIAELSKVPESTVGRILRGATEDPRYETVCEMVRAMENYIKQNQADGEDISDGDVAETPEASQGRVPSEIPAETNDNKNLIQVYEHRLTDQQSRIDELKQLNEKLEGNISRLSCQCASNRRRFIIALVVAACVITFIFALFFVDFIHPARGWVLR